MFNKLKALLLIPFLLAGYAQPVDAFEIDDFVPREYTIEAPSDVTVDDLKENLQFGAAGDITYGSSSTFNNANTTRIHIACLDDTHFVFCYRDGGNSGYGTCIVGVTDGDDTISSWGAENVYNSADTEYQDVAMISSSTFVVAYETSLATYARIGSVSGTTISSYGTATRMQRAQASQVAVTVMDSGAMAVAVNQSFLGSTGQIVRATISGTTIGFPGAVKNFDTDGVNDTTLDLVTLDDTHVAISWESIGDSKGYSMVAVESGTTFNLGSEVEFNSASISHVGSCSLDSTHFVVIYREDTGDSEGRIGVVSSGDVINFGDVETFVSSAGSTYNNCTKLSDTEFATVYRDLGDGGDGKVKLGTVASGDEITFGSEYEFETSSTFITNICSLDSTHLAIGYLISSTPGTGIIGVIDEGGGEVRIRFHIID